MKNIDIVDLDIADLPFLASEAATEISLLRKGIETTPIMARKLAGFLSKPRDATESPARYFFDADSRIAVANATHHLQQEASSLLSSMDVTAVAKLLNDVSLSTNPKILEPLQQFCQCLDELSKSREPFFKSDDDIPKI